MRREVRILSALEHSHLLRAHAVVRLPAHDSGGSGLGLVLDYAPGGSLATLVGSRGRLGPGETVTVLTPIAQALAYLHGQGFTHGDVAPGNVLFTADGKPLLADLGVARMVADAAPVAEAGTAGFRDPAPVDAVRAGLQPERDIYSLAALGWYCLTGRAPEPGAHRPPLSLLVAGGAGNVGGGPRSGAGRGAAAASPGGGVCRNGLPQRPGGARRSVCLRASHGHPPAAHTQGRAARSAPGAQALSGRPDSTADSEGPPRGGRCRSALAAAVLLAGTWLLAGGGPASDVVAGLFPGFGPGEGVPVQAGVAAGQERPAAPSEGPAGGSPPSTADGGATVSPSRPGGAAGLAGSGGGRPRSRPASLARAQLRGLRPAR